MPYCGWASGVLSILIVSAERRFVTAVGSARPVRAAVRRCGTVVEVVVDAVVVVVVSAAPTLAAAPLSIKTAATTKGRRRMGKNYCFRIRRGGRANVNDETAVRRSRLYRSPDPS